MRPTRIETWDLAHLEGLTREFSATAADVDAGLLDVRDGLRRLGERGLLDPHHDPAERLRRTVRLLRALAAASLADAFVAWSQTMVIDYLTRYPEPSGTLDGLVAGTLPGATALAPAVADVAGGPPVPVVAEPDGTGWRLSGPVPWASNLFPGAALVVPARTPDNGRLVVVLSVGDRGVDVAPPTPLLALDATATSSVRLTGARAGPDAVLTRDLSGFLGRCRSVMLLSLAALALGVADAALDAAAARLDGPAAVLRPDHEALTTARGHVAAHVLAAGDAATGRMEALRLAARAVELEGLACGGTGFRAAGATSRRRREAAFLPLQAPTLLQLRAAE